MSATTELKFGGVPLELSPGFKNVHDGGLRIQRWKDLCFLSGHTSANQGLVARVPKACIPQGVEKKARMIFTAIEVVDGKPGAVRVDVSTAELHVAVCKDVMCADHRHWRGVANDHEGDRLCIPSVDELGRHHVRRASREGNAVGQPMGLERSSGRRKGYARAHVLEAALGG